MAQDEGRVKAEKKEK